MAQKWPVKTSLSLATLSGSGWACDLNQSKERVIRELWEPLEQTIPEEIKSEKVWHRGRLAPGQHLPAQRCHEKFKRERDLSTKVESPALNWQNGQKMKALKWEWGEGEWKGVDETGKQKEKEERNSVSSLLWGPAPTIPTNSSQSPPPSQKFSC